MNITLCSRPWSLPLKDTLNRYADLSDDPSDEPPCGVYQVWYSSVCFRYSKSPKPC